jgi:hypothetical protein
MRWDREDELDLADIGGEAGAATHGASIAPPGRRPKRLDMAKPPCNRLENKQGTQDAGQPTRNNLNSRATLPGSHQDWRVPPEGLGQRHTHMTAWLDENCGPDGWADGVFRVRADEPGARTAASMHGTP